MKTIIAGSRTITDMAHISEAVDESGFEITEVVSGCADGVDKLGEEWADWMGLPVKRFPADWKQYGKSAGYQRNEEMARYADALIAIWDGSSKGTAHMIDTAKKSNTMLIWVVNLSKEGWAQNELPL
jgi:hypothetical protein